MDLRYHHENCYDGYSSITSSEQIFKRPGIYYPVLVQTQAEKDYLDGMALMYGKELGVFVLGGATPDTDLPWTYLSVTIDLSLLE